ncbi:alpha/beta fold hydrolase [Agarivorans sp. 1_MG-2023]|uniref:alpha/beta fold hydrolase n=1 Tax=Agarivorans sp. 1_MG-2023 TaxID=3062634 RepID=UPI0026E3D528|nr:alpha/beta fold hydrolase [Agarivorans sp. 1_MG-2023]MDO6765057.1 alpha/beta fold hydrolase [Agarivorans sp. 1_MG-2023]
MNSLDSTKERELTSVDNREQLIGMIYRAAAEPEYWPDLLEHLYMMPELQRTEAPGKQDNSSAKLSQMLDAVSPQLSMAQSQYSERNQLLLEHFNQALNIAKRIYQLEEKNHSLNSLLDHIPVGVILVNAQSEILLTNELAEETLQLGQGLYQKNKNLVTQQSESTELLKQYVEELSSLGPNESSSRGLPIQVNNETDVQTMVILSPVNHLQDPLLERNASVVVFISPSRPDVELDLAAFADGYKLTPKEARIVNYIAQGMSPPDIADKIFVSYNTVRTQLKSVFKKTGVSSQSELASLVLTGPWGMLSQSSRHFDFGTPQDSNARYFRLPDERKLCYQEFGDPKGKPVVYCHSILGCRLENFFDQVDIAAQLGIRLISIDRPGFGGSDYHESYSFVQWTADLKALLEHLNLAKVELLGYATGGVYAACSAAKIPDMVSHLTIVSSGDALTYDSDYKATAKLYRMHMKLARDFPNMHRLFTNILDKGLHKDPNKLFKVLARDLEGTDVELFESPMFKEKFGRYLMESKVQGGNAFSDEVRQVMAPWGFEIEDVKVATQLFHGENDKHIPLTLAERFIARAENARLEVIPELGHYMIYQHWPAILESIAKRKS